MNNKTVGIVCEYNPFHYGHRYHIQKSKEISGADSAICIMSGSFVQRGEVALFDKWQRAKMAVSNGADLVIELPAYYVLQSSDNFAYGAVRILDMLSVIDAISFGSENDDIEILKKCADAIKTDEYSSFLKSKMDEGCSYPSACEYALSNVIGCNDTNLHMPNSILAISYLSALSSIGSKLEPYCIKRDNDYHSIEPDDEFISATALRFMIKNKADYTQYAPSYDGITTHYLENAESYILGFFRNAKKEEFEDIKGYEEGLFSLIQKSAKMSFDVNEFYAACVSKRYTLSRIKRFSACALLGIRGDLTPSYVRVLAFNKKGAALLKEIKKKSPLTIITKAADYEGDEMFEMDVRATDLHLSAHPTKIKYFAPKILSLHHI